MDIILLTEMYIVFVVYHVFTRSVFNSSNDIVKPHK